VARRFDAVIVDSAKAIGVGEIYSEADGMTCIRGLVWLGAVILVAECASSCSAAAARSSAALTANVAVPRLVQQGT
jgi:hypothetical protein